MELNKTEDNKCCFLHFGRGVQDPLSGDQGGSLDPWTPPPPWIRPSPMPPFEAFPADLAGVVAADVTTLADARMVTVGVTDLADVVSSP